MTFNSRLERGRIEGFGYLNPATTTASPSATDLQTEAAKAVEERDFKLISKSWWQIYKRRVFHVFADSDHLLLFYFPALLCVFSPALVENGIRYIFLEGASPVSIPGLLANNAQGPEEMCLSLEHRNPSKTSEKWVISFDRVTVSLHIL